MPWEDVPATARGNQPGRMEPDEVAILQSKVKNGYLFRINMSKEHFPEDVERVIVSWDKERGLLGLFKSSSASVSTRKLSRYGPRNRLVYVSMPRSIVDLGFSPGRYKVTRSDDPDIYFSISAESQVVAYGTKKANVA